MTQRYTRLVLACLLLLEEANGFSLSFPRVRTQRSTREGNPALFYTPGADGDIGNAAPDLAIPPTPHPPKTPPSWEQINANAACASEGIPSFSSVLVPISSSSLILRKPPTVLEAIASGLLSVISTFGRFFENTTTIKQWRMNNRIAAIPGQQTEQLATTALVGGLAGGMAVAPYSFVHYFPYITQFQGTIELAVIEAALFALVYRAVVMPETKDRMPQSAVVGAFVAARTFANLYVTNAACTAFPAQCGPDWNVWSEAALQGLESAIVFGAASLAMDACFQNGWISTTKK